MVTLNTEQISELYEKTNLMWDEGSWSLQSSSDGKSFLVGGNKACHVL